MRTVEDITQLDVLNFLPQRPPFVLIDKLLSYDIETTQTTTYYKVKPDSTFVENGDFQPAGLVENIAQTCAARIGYTDWLHERPIKVGVIGEVKNMNIFILPKVYDELITTIEVVSEVMGVTLAKAVVKDVMQNLIAKCDIKIAI